MLMRDDRIHFNGDAKRQGRDSNRAPRMAAGFSKHVLHQLGSAVRYLRLVGEGGGAVHENAKLHDLLHAIERSERRLHLRQKHDSAATCRSDSRVDVHVLAKAAFDQAAVLCKADLP